jgi:RNA methyltransferase, TrmH family
MNHSEQSRPGQVREITAFTNPVIKDIRALALKKNRDATGRFVAEGLKLLTDALDGGWEIQTVIYARHMSSESRIQDAASRARVKGALIVETSEKLLAAITRRDNPQMVVSVVGQRWQEPDAIHPQETEMWIVLDRVRDPGNLGTIIRTADCVGASGVLLVGESTDPWGAEAVRASMGSIFHVPVGRMTQEAFAKWRKSWQGVVIGTHLDGALDYRELSPADRPVLLLMGNEQQGLPEALVAMCDYLCLIPMAGKADSLNLAVATGIMAFELRRRHLKIATNSGVGQ